MTHEDYTVDGSAIWVDSGNEQSNFWNAAGHHETDIANAGKNNQSGWDTSASHGFGPFTVTGGNTVIGITTQNSSSGDDYSYDAAGGFFTQYDQGNSSVTGDGTYSSTHDDTTDG